LSTTFIFLSSLLHKFIPPAASQRLLGSSGGVQGVYQSSGITIIWCLSNVTSAILCDDVFRDVKLTLEIDHARWNYCYRGGFQPARGLMVLRVGTGLVTAHKQSLESILES
jgi:hypothetical protein